MESPARYLERRNAEVDRDLAESCKRLANGDDAAALVRDHPITALGGGAAAGFLATGLLIRGRGMKLVRRVLRLFRPMASAAFLGALRRHAPPAPDATEDHPAAAAD